MDSNISFPITDLENIKNISIFEFYAAERKKELIPFATAWMKLERIMLSEISQEVRDSG